MWYTQCPSFVQESSNLFGLGATDMSSFVFSADLCQLNILLHSIGLQVLSVATKVKICSFPSTFDQITFQYILSHQNCN